MLPMLVSSAQRLPWPSCSMPNLVGKASVKSGSWGIYASPLHATGPHQQKVSFAKKEAPPGLSPPPKGTASSVPVTYTWPVSWATTNAEEKPSSWLRVQLRSGWHIPVTGA